MLDSNLIQKPISRPSEYHEMVLSRLKNTDALKYLENITQYDAENDLILTSGSISQTIQINNQIKILHGIHDMSRYDVERYMHLGMKFNTVDQNIIRYLNEIGHYTYKWLDLNSQNSSNIYNTFLDIKSLIELTKYRAAGLTITRVAQLTNIDLTGIEIDDEEYNKRMIKAKLEVDFSQLLAMALFDLNYFKDYLHRYISADKNIVSHGKAFKDRLEICRINRIVMLEPDLANEIKTAFSNFIQGIQYQVEENPSKILNIQQSLLLK